METSDRFPKPFPPPFADAWGDDEFGLWAEFTLPTASLSAPPERRAASHIFISHAREDAETAKRLETIFRNRGWPVWSDSRLSSGDVWVEVLEQALANSLCVVVLWSRHSIDSASVTAEAKYALERKILVPALIEPLQPPPTYRSVLYCDLTGWRGEEDHPHLLRVLEAVSAFIKPRRGKTNVIAQRLRWIEPGTFRMGSPRNEPERGENEGPQHRVTISRGFWLADTACTQALWTAVIDHNPSRFTGDDQRPVEEVSWNAVERFLRALEQRLPACEAGLPTEAEWEYACRAGTDTPFSFGRQITPEQVNYDGRYPYASGEEGVYRRQTVPVKSLPPNRWGLYEMHGNVWEWCADGLRIYTDQAQTDPFGDPGEGDAALRAVRGGSWDGGARWVRSACRDADPPVNGVDLLGFRLSLRSIEPGKSGGRPGGPA